MQNIRFEISFDAFKQIRIRNLEFDEVSFKDLNCYKDMRIENVLPYSSSLKLLNNSIIVWTLDKIRHG